MGTNRNLRKAKKQKNDEFYTRYEDIEKELCHYAKHFKDKVIYCNCDDPDQSQFVKYFLDHFNEFKLKKFIASCYVQDGKGKCLIADKHGTRFFELNSDGDFRSEECLELLKCANIVVTNPPFSLFTEFIDQLISHNKNFILVASSNCIASKMIFKLFINNKLHFGSAPMYNEMYFDIPDYYKRRLVRYNNRGSGYVVKKKEVLGRVQATWITNLTVNRDNYKLHLWKVYNKNEYHKYDNYDAINIDSLSDIPLNYYDVMGVPITFLNYYDLEQFEIIGAFNGYAKCDYDNGFICGNSTPYIDKKGNEGTTTGPTVNKKRKFHRILIKRKKQFQNNI